MTTVSQLANELHLLKKVGKPELAKTSFFSRFAVALCFCDKPVRAFLTFRVRLDAPFFALSVADNFQRINKELKVCRPASWHNLRQLQP